MNDEVVAVEVVTEGVVHKKLFRLVDTSSLIETSIEGNYETKLIIMERTEI
jgi:hypothetical protein